MLAEHKVKPPLVFAGFSQGVSMAFRAAVTSTVLPVAVVAVGGDVPPEIQPEMMKRLSGAMLCRGVSDPYYSNEKFRDDEARLISAGVNARVLEFDGGHVWPHELDEILPRFMRDWFPDSTATVEGMAAAEAPPGRPRHGAGGGARSPSHWGNERRRRPLICNLLERPSTKITPPHEADHRVGAALGHSSSGA